MPVCVKRRLASFCTVRLNINYKKDECTIVHILAFG